MKRTLVAGVLGLAIVASGVVPAFAADNGVAGKKVLLKDGNKQKLNALLKGSSVAGISAEELATLQGSVGGALLDVCAGNGSSGSMELPWANWSMNKKGTLLKYKDKGNTSGVKVITLKPGKLIKIVGKNTVVPMGTPLEGIGMRLTTGSETNCALFGSSTAKKDTGSLFKAKKSTAPADCSDATLLCAPAGSPSGAFLD
jgi:hypothetical protein